MPNRSMVNGRWLLLAAVCSGVAQVESLLLDRRSGSLHGHLAQSSATPSCAELTNRESHFTARIGVGTPISGTPAQKFDLVADTGSDTVIVKSCICGNFSHHCAIEPTCFQGTNRSSTFIPPEKGWQNNLDVLSFGSGDIVITPASDVIQVGDHRSFMDQALMLMIDRKLWIPPGFEGILGLGLPSWAALDGENDGHKHFLETAKVSMFSMCFKNNGEPGVLTFESPPAPKMLKHVGLYHWGLELRGFSVGSSEAQAQQVQLCLESSKTSGQKTACGAIPDSGTTYLMGPQKHVEMLYTDICQRWPRCKKGADPESDADFKITKDLYGEEKARRMAPQTRNYINGMFFKKLLDECDSWIGNGDGLDEVPSLFLHLAGADGDKQTLELSSWTYISRTSKKSACKPMIGVYDYITKLHGPIWIIGTPLFMEYQVVFGMKPPSIGFSEQTCTRCGDGATLENASTELLKAKAQSYGSRGAQRARHIPRQMSKEPRMPRINVTRPF